MKFRAGDAVLFFPFKDNWFFETYVVQDFVVGGIPSFPYPMVKLKGKAGYVDAAHCFPFPKAKKESK